MRVLCLIAFATVAVTTFTSTSLAHEGATGLVKERMDQMNDMGKAMKAMAEQLRANRLSSLDGEVAVIHAAAVRIPQLFPPGSDQRPTDAKPEIWSRWDDFSAQAKKLGDESTKLAALVSGGDPGSVRGQLRIVGDLCASCHKAYRNKEQ